MATPICPFVAGEAVIVDGKRREIQKVVPDGERFFVRFVPLSNCQFELRNVFWPNGFYGKTMAKIPAPEGQ